MKYFSFLTIILIFVFALPACQQPGEREEKVKSKEKAPNIIFILTDDLGYGDVGVLYQSQREVLNQPFHKTPHLDNMANEGVLLTRHYVPAPVCAPSRASLMLGLHQGHANVRNNQFDKALIDNHNLASVLKEAGYATGIVGKWGLQGKEGNSPASWEAYPTKRGFDYFLGYVRHVDGHNHYPAHPAANRPPMELYHGNEEISGQLKGVYTADLFTAAAKKWITSQKNNSPDQPFFLYLAYDTPHAGLQVASSPYPEGGGLNGGVQWTGESGNFINTVSDTINTYIHPDYAVKDWPEPQKRFASMVRRIDNAVGDLMQLLKDLDIDEETMVVFTSDNGPHEESYGYGDYQPTFFDSYGPLDGIKRDVLEGGIRVPAIVRWPHGISAKQLNNTPSGFHDWLPTFAQLAGLPAPANTDGVSLVPLLTGEGVQKPGTVYIEYQEPNRKTPDYEEFHPSHRGKAHGEMQVIYLDGYKGIRTNIQSAADDFMIYDTTKDPQELNDLAGSSKYFLDLQEGMKARVLQVRRPNSSAVRPYDNIPVPALKTVPVLDAGLKYRVFELETPWTPAISSLSDDPVKTGVSKEVDLSGRTRDRDFVMEYSGLIEVPQSGAYTFLLQSGKGAVMHLHDAILFDADRGYVPGSMLSSTIYLEKGFHPVQLVYAHGKEGEPALQLEWQGPGFSQRSLEPEQLFHQKGKTRL